MNVVAVWERGHLVPVTPDTILADGSFPVVMGSEEQITNLDTYLVIYNTNFNPVLVIGGGKVGGHEADGPFFVSDGKPGSGAVPFLLGLNKARIMEQGRDKAKLHVTG